MPTPEPISRRDSLDLWRLKTNQLISTNLDSVENLQYTQLLDSQFRYIPAAQDGLNVSFRGGVARRKTETKKTGENTVTLKANATNLVYIDFYDMDNVPLKSIPISFTLGGTFPQVVQLGTADISEFDDIDVFVTNGVEIDELVKPLSNNVIDPSDQYWIDYENNTITFQITPPIPVTESFTAIPSFVLSLATDIKTYFTITVTNDTTSLLLINETDYTIDYDTNEITIVGGAILGDDIIVYIQKNSPVRAGAVVYLKSPVGDYISKPDIVPIYEIATSGNDVSSVIDLRTWAFINTTIQTESGVPQEKVYVFDQQITTHTFDDPVDECLLYVDGIRYILGVDYTQKSSKTIEFVNPVPAGTKIIIITFAAASGLKVYSIDEIRIATTNGQTDFDFTNFTLDVEVYLWVNGIRQPISAYTVDTANNRIVLSTGVAIGTTVFASKNIIGQNGFVFVGGKIGQIAQKQSDIQDDWIWIDAEFDSSKFISGKFSAQVFPIAFWSFADFNTVDTVITPEFLKYANFLPSNDNWVTNYVGNRKDFIFTGHNHHTYRGEGHTHSDLQWTSNGYVKKADYAYHEVYACQKYGRILKNPQDFGSSAKNDVPNAPFPTNDITLTRKNPIPRPAYHTQTCYDLLVAVGDSGKIAYSRNIIQSSLNKTATFERWVEIPSTSTPFSSDWNLTGVASIIVEKPAQTGKTPKEGWDFVFVAAYNPTTNRSNVAWKLAVDVVSPNTAWNYLHGSSGVSGKITNIHEIDMDSSCAAWAIDDKVYSVSYSQEFTSFNMTRETTESKPVVTQNFTTPLTGLIYADGEEAIKIHCTPTWDGEPSGGVFWSIATKPKQRNGGTVSGRLYVRGGTSYSPDAYYMWLPSAPYPANAPQNSKWNLVTGIGEDVSEIDFIAMVGGVNQASSDSDARNRATFYFGDSTTKVIGGIDSSTNGLEIDSRVASSSVCGRIVNGKQFIHGKIVGGVEFQNPLVQAGNSYISENLIVQNEQADTAKIRYRIGTTDVITNGHSVEIDEAFKNDKGLVPSVGMFSIVSNGQTQLAVARPPVNCGWILTNGQSGGTIIPFEGNVFGAFYEGNRFFVITSKYIYEANNNLVWKKTQYNPNSDLVEKCDLTYTTFTGKIQGINAIGIYFLANGFDGAVGAVRANGNIDWYFYNKLSSGNAIKPQTIVNSVVGFLGNASSGVVGFYDGYKTTAGTNIGTISPLSFSGYTIGCLSPVVENPTETNWKFILRGLEIDPQAVRSLRLIGRFKNHLGVIDAQDTNLIISAENSPVNVIEDTVVTSQSYGTSWIFKISGANNKFLVAGNTYDFLINDISVGSLAFDSDVPDKVVTASTSEVKIFGISKSGRLVYSVDGQAWTEIPNQRIKVYGSQDPDEESTIIPTTNEERYTAVQYNEFIKAFVCARKNGRTVVFYDTGLVEEYVNTQNIGGAINDQRPIFTNGEYIIDLTGKRFFLFAVTNIGRTFISVDGSTWYKFNNPIHSKDIPSGITYDNLGNHFVCAKTINNKTGELPKYHRMRF